MKFRYLAIAISGTLIFNASTLANASESNANINGFASIAYTDSANDSGYAHVDEGNFFPESVFGLQSSFKLENNFDALIQVTARGQEDWELDVTMAYVGYDFDNGAKVRAGVLRMPLFFFSEYLEVGYAQPWARSPYEVYGLIPVQSITGADLQYEFEFFDSYLALQAFTGSQPFEYEGAEGDLKNAHGVSAMWYDDNLSFRVGYNIAKADSAGLNTFDEDASFLSLGGRYEDGPWLALAEYTQTRISDNNATPMYPENDAGYLTFGYRINSIMPYISYSRIETKNVSSIKTNPSNRPAINAGLSTMGEAIQYKTNAYSVGARWDIQSGVALKGDLTYVDYLGTSGGLGELRPTGFVANDIDYDIVYTAKLDITF